MLAVERYKEKNKKQLVNVLFKKRYTKNINKKKINNNSNNN